MNTALLRCDHPFQAIELFLNNQEKNVWFSVKDNKEARSLKRCIDVI